MRERFYFGGALAVAGLLIFLGRDLLATSVVVSWTLTLGVTGLVAALTVAFYKVRAELQVSRHALARNEAELSFALQVQRALFPKELPQDAGLEFSAICIPARGISGDYYDVLRLEDGRLAFLLADISGKGISAAILMANLQALLRATVEAHTAPEKVCHRLNHHLCRVTEASRFATLFYGEWDPARNRFRYVNAGHLAPIVVGSNDGHRFERGGYPLGLFENATYDAGELQLRPGDLLVLYSDGITEKGESRGQEFGLERLRRMLHEDAARPLEEIQSRLIDEVSRWGGAEPEDDMTIMLVRVGGRSEGE